MKIVYDEQLMKYIALVENLTKVNVKDMFLKNNMLYCVIDKENLRKIIGPNGSKIKRIENLIKKKVDGDMEIIKKTILENIKPISIISFGSFSKYEGFVEVKNGKILPLNDYDLYLVSDKKLNEKFLDELGQKCSKAIGRGGYEYAEYPEQNYDKNKFFHVDLRNLVAKNLKRLLPTLRTYELRRAKIIYGENVLNQIPDIKPPVSESIRYLFNKMHQLVLSKDTNNLYETIHIAKVYTDVCTSLLVYENKYASGYEERNKIFQKLNYPKELKDKINWATKLRFNFKPLTNTKKSWEEAVYWTGFTLKKILITELNLKKDDWDYVIRQTYKKLPYIYFKPYLKFNLFFLQYYLNIKYVLNSFRKKEFLIKPLLRWRDSGIILGVILMEYLYGSKSKYYLKKITSNTEPLKTRILKLYALYYTQRLV